MGEGAVFQASMSARNRLVTYGVGWGVLLGVPTLLGLLFVVGMGEVGALFLPAMALVGMALVQAFRTRGFAVDREGITVMRLLRPRTIPLEELVEVRSDAEPPTITLYRRALNGFYGMHGTFWNRELGNFELYVTDPENMVLLVTRSGEHVYVSLDERSEFVSLLQTLFRKMGSAAVVTVGPSGG